MKPVCNRQLFFWPISTLLMGGAIYIFFRSSSILMFSWIEKAGLSYSISNIRESMLPLINKIPSWFLFSLPDGLWVFSYVSLILALWNNCITLKSLPWIISIPLLAVSSEIGQRFGFIAGVYDNLDFLFYSLGGALPFIFFKKSITLKFRTS